MPFVYFLGRLHVLALHLPIGIILAAVCMDWLATRPRFRHLRAAAPFMWSAAAVSAVVTVALGYMHATEGGFAGPELALHRFYGSSVAVLAVAVLGVRAFSPHSVRIGLAASGMLVVLLALAGHYGGNLTHGSTYLIEYAPLEFGRGGAPRATPVPAGVAEADRQILESLVADGFVARPLSQTDPRLSVIMNPNAAGIRAEQLESLRSGAGRIKELNLSRAGIDDAALGFLVGFENLTLLRLDNNRITDVGVAALGGITSLEYLNLYGNPGITDASVDSLVALANLRALYVWGTSISAEGLAKLHDARPELRVETGAEPAGPAEPGGGTREPGQSTLPGQL